jgi:heptaprenyl diphosphate synthase
VLLASHSALKRWVGPVGLSVLAAFGHLAGQLTLVAVWLLPGVSLVPLLPVFALAALVFGTINGVIAARLLAAPAPDKRQSRPCTNP